MTKRFVDNDKYSATMRTAVNSTRDLNKIVRDLFDASDSDWVLHDDDRVTLIFPTVHMTKWGWDNVDGSRATKKDLGGYTLRMIDRLADLTDIVDMWYPKDGHVGIHFNRRALKRRIDPSILKDFNLRAGFRDYIPGCDDSLDDWYKKNMMHVIF